MTLALWRLNKWVQKAGCVALRHIGVGQIILYKAVKGFFLSYVRQWAILEPITN